MDKALKSQWDVYGIPSNGATDRYELDVATAQISFDCLLDTVPTQFLAINPAILTVYISTITFPEQKRLDLPVGYTSGDSLTQTAISRKRDKPGSIFYETRITFFSFEIYQTRINFVLGCHAKFS